MRFPRPGRAGARPRRTRTRWRDGVRPEGASVASAAVATRKAVVIPSAASRSRAGRLRASRARDARTSSRSAPMLAAGNAEQRERLRRGPARARVDDAAVDDREDSEQAPAQHLDAERSRPIGRDREQARLRAAKDDADRRARRGAATRQEQRAALPGRVHVEGLVAVDDLRAAGKRPPGRAGFERAVADERVGGAVAPGGKGLEYVPGTMAAGLPA